MPQHVSSSLAGQVFQAGGGQQSPGILHVTPKPRHRWQGE